MHCVALRQIKNAEHNNNNEIHVGLKRMSQKRALLKLALSYWG